MILFSIFRLLSAFAVFRHADTLRLLVFAHIDALIAAAILSPLSFLISIFLLFAYATMPDAATLHFDMLMLLLSLLFATDMNIHGHIIFFVIDAAMLPLPPLLIFSPRTLRTAPCRYADDARLML